MAGPTGACGLANEAVARAFRGRLKAQRRLRVRAVLETLAMTGVLHAAGETGMEAARYVAMG